MDTANEPATTVSTAIGKQALATTARTPFLLQVARYLLDNNSGTPLHDLCVVFPNRRSCQFFNRAMQHELMLRDAVKRNRGEATTPHLLPLVIDFNTFISRVTHTVTATDIEMVFALYDAYCSQMGEQAATFDQFVYWSQLIIADFNEIDKSLADAHAIYANINDLRSISSNYISKEVLEKTRSLFGDSLFTPFFDTSQDADLWRPTNGTADKDNNATGEVKQEFITLWNRLAAIYDEYHTILAKSQVTAPGRQVRLAVDAQVNDSDMQHLVFVGFGALSAGQMKLFKRLKSTGKALYCWDSAGLSQQAAIAPNDPGCRLMSGYIAELGNIPIVDVEQADLPIDLHIYNVPSAAGQAKVAFDTVQHLVIDGHIPHPDNAIDTAIILPDEQLLSPLLHSVKGVTRLNITLGYPLRHASIVSLMHIVAIMHRRAQVEGGSWCYYREDVKNLLSHPIIKTHFTAQAIECMDHIMQANPFMVPASWFDNCDFKDLFTPAMDSQQEGSDSDKACSYIDQLLRFCDILMQRMQQHATPVVDDGPNDEDIDHEVMPLQQAFLVMYINVLNQLKPAIMAHGLKLQSTTVFHLIDRLASSAIIPFSGEPLRGLQVMGILETRCLDFDNIIVMSTNERFIPGIRGTGSFIPNYIRRGYGLTTIEQQQAIASFNFFRLLNRARHVHYIVDTDDTMGGSDPSRFLQQMHKVYGMTFKVHNYQFDPTPKQPLTISVPNDKTAQRKYSGNEAPDGKRHYLSASAINCYIECPLQFWLHYIQDLNNDDEASDLMDASTFGSIIHNSLRDIYLSRGAGGEFKLKDIAALIKHNSLERIVKRNIMIEHLHQNPDTDPDKYNLTGEGYMLLETITQQVRRVLEYDKQELENKGLDSLTIIDCEHTMVIDDYHIGDATFNLKFIADRIDKVGDTIRIVDYKTGKDATSFTSVEQLFTPGEKRPKAILQLLLYCHAYMQQNNDITQVTPVIYKINNLESSGVTHNRGANNKVQYTFSADETIAQEFTQCLGENINKMFSEPFGQAATDSKHCRYCRFLDYCQRIKPKDTQHH